MPVLLLRFDAIQPIALISANLVLNSSSEILFEDIISEGKIERAE
jgi:hypothetical protein